MNSRERLHAALNHQPTDRIPMDFCGTSRTGIAATALYHLRQCLDLSIPVRLYNVYESTAEIDDQLAKTIGTDTMALPIPLPLLNIQCLGDASKKHWKSYALEDGTPVFIPNDFYPEREYNGDLCLRDMQDRRFALLKCGDFRFTPLFTGPGALKMTPEQIQNELEARNPAVGWPKDAAYWQMLKLASQTFAKTSDKALVIDANPFLPFFSGLGQGDMGTWLELLAANDANADAVLDFWSKCWLEELGKLLDNTGDSLDVVVLSDDFSFVSQPEDEQLVKSKILPRYAEGIRFLREKRGNSLKVLWQSMGSTWPYIPDLIAMGVDALGLVDLMAKRTNALTIKAEFGRDLALWGGICSAGELVAQTEDFLLRKLREDTERLTEGGGYIHALSGNILPETPPENVLTFFSLRG